LLGPERGADAVTRQSVTEAPTKPRIAAVSRSGSSARIEWLLFSNSA
jgi:hypothetical protein